MSEENKELKTIKELNEMKNEKCNIFGTKFNFYIQQLVDYLISKSDGCERVISSISHWDLDANVEIMRNINKIIIQNYPFMGLEADLEEIFEVIKSKID